jgi:hypothetical protein
MKKKLDMPKPKVRNPEPKLKNPEPKVKCKLKTVYKINSKIKTIR